MYISSANLDECPGHNSAIRRHRIEIVVVVHIITLPVDLEKKVHCIGLQ